MKKDGLAWGKIWGITVKNPDGFGERFDGAPMFDSLMTEDQYIACMELSTCEFHSQGQFLKRLTSELDKFKQYDHDPEGGKHNAKFLYKPRRLAKGVY